jgi:hypothetical protein
MHEHAPAAPDATTVHDGGPAADHQFDGAALYAVGPDGAPLHDKHSIQKLHAQAVKDGRTSDAHAYHEHLDHRFGGGDFHHSDY